MPRTPLELFRDILATGLAIVEAELNASEADPVPDLFKEPVGDNPPTAETVAGSPFYSDPVAPTVLSEEAPLAEPPSDTELPVPDAVEANGDTTHAAQSETGVAGTPLGVNSDLDDLLDRPPPAEENVGPQ